MLTEVYRCKIDGKEFFVPVDIIDGKWVGSKAEGYRTRGLRDKAGVEVFEKGLRELDNDKPVRVKGEQMYMFGPEVGSIKPTGFGE